MRARSSVSPEPIGIGCSAMPSHLGVLGLVADVIDLVEVSPEALTRELPSSELSMPRARLDRDLVDPVLAACGRLPVISHGMELSIGTAAGWNHESLSVLDDFGRTVDYRWHSEHIGFTSAPDRDGIVRGVGLPLPLPFTTEVADMVAARADMVARRLGRTFLLENSPRYLPDLPSDPGWDEARFLTELCRRSSCGLLLDLFNLHANCTNLGLDPFDLIDRIPLDRVVEVHVAGGAEHRGFLVDTHSTAVPDRVWNLLEDLLRRAPKLAAVVFEVSDDCFPALGIDVFRSEIEKLRELWDHARGRLVGVPR